MFWGPFGARFAPNRPARQVGETGAHPSTFGCGNTCQKLLKTRRLQTFQFDAKVPTFRQTNGRAEKGNTLRHGKHTVRSRRAAR